MPDTDLLPFWTGGLIMPCVGRGGADEAVGLAGELSA